MVSRRKKKTNQLKPPTPQKLNEYLSAKETALLNITVAVSPSNEMSVGREVQMVKAALLYADKVD